MPGAGKKRRPTKECERARLALWEVAVLVRLVSGAARWGAVGLALALVVACRQQSGERAGEQSKQRAESAEVAAEEATPTPTSGDETKTKTKTETDTETGVLDEPVLQEGDFLPIYCGDRPSAVTRACFTAGARKGAPRGALCNRVASQRLPEQRFSIGDVALCLRHSGSGDEGRIFDLPSRLAGGQAICRLEPGAVGRHKLRPWARASSMLPSGPVNFWRARGRVNRGGAVGWIRHRRCGRPRGIWCTSLGAAVTSGQTATR